MCARDSHMRARDSHMRVRDSHMCACRLIVVLSSCAGCSVCCENCPQSPGSNGDVYSYHSPALEREEPWSTPHWCLSRDGNVPGQPRLSSALQAGEANQ